MDEPLDWSMVPSGNKQQALPQPVLTEIYKAPYHTSQGLVID